MTQSLPMRAATALAAVFCAAVPGGAQTAPAEEPVLRLAEVEVAPAERFAPVLARSTAAVALPNLAEVDLAGWPAPVLDFGDLAAFTAGAYSPHRFGNPTNLNLRGDLAELFVNGQKLTGSQYGTQPNFAGAGTVEVGRGAAPVSYGGGLYPSGFVDLRTAPPSGANGGRATLRLGSWAPDGRSWRTFEAQLEADLALAPEWAARAVYLGRDDETRFAANGGQAKAQELVLAASWRPAERAFTLDLNARLAWQGLPQLMGVNRPSPELVEDGWYYTGAPPDLGGPFAGVWVLTPTGRVQIPRDATELSPGDFSDAVLGHAQAVARWDFSGWALTARSLAEATNRRRYHRTEYSEYVEQWAFDERLEADFNARVLGLETTQRLGASARHERVEAYVNYFNEYAFNVDLSQDPATYALRESYPNTYFPGRPGPGGRLFFSTEEGLAETALSHLTELALFWEQEVRLGRGWSLGTGLRATQWLARSEDPLPPDDTPWSDSDTFNAGSAQASLRWQATAADALYLTAARTAALNLSVSGGAVMLQNGRLNPADFDSASVLYEVGWDHRSGPWQGRAAAFWQERQRTEFYGGGASDLLVRGLELDGRWRSGPWLAFANLAWTFGRYDNSAPYQQGGRSLYDQYALGTGPLGRGTGLGYNARQAPPGDYFLPGLSRLRLNAGAGYEPAAGLGALVWGGWQSEQRANLDGEYRLPAVFLLHGQLSWKAAAWELRLRGENLLDETVWVHNGADFFNNLLVGRGDPRRFNVELSWRWR